MNAYYVYILKCSDHSYYTGVTNDYKRRLYEYNTGLDRKSYTFRHRPLKLVYVTEFRDIEDAVAFEKKIKGWSRKKL